MPNPSQRRGAVALTVLSVAAFMASLDVFIVNVAFDSIGADFDGARLAELSWVLNAYAIVYAALLIPAGRIADRYGRKEGFLTGLTLFVVASTACALAPGVWWLVGFRVAQAAGAALLTPASLGLVLASAPLDRRASWVRIWASTGAVAAALGPVAGGLLVELDWRWVFLVNVPVGVVALVAAVRILPRSRDESVARLPDVFGAALLAIAIGALTLGLVEGPAWGWVAPRTITAWVITVIAFAAFLASSARHPAPIVEPELIKVRPFAWANATSLLFAVPFAASLLTNILWMQQVWGYAAVRVGFAVAPGPLMVPIFALVSHRLSRRVPVGVIVAVGCLCMGVGGLITAMSVGAEPNYATEILPGWLIGGVGVGLALPTILSSATADLPPTRAATGSAVVNMNRQIGTALGVSLVVAFIGTPNGYAEAHNAFQHAWCALAVVAVLAAVAAIGMTPTREPVEPAVRRPAAAQR